MTIAARTRCSSLRIWTLFAALACLARYPDGSYMIPSWLAMALQAPAAFMYAWNLIKPLSTGQLARRRIDAGLFGVLLIGGASLAVLHRSADALFITMTAYLTGWQVLDFSRHKLSTMADAIESPMRLWREAVPVWMAIIPVATVLLAMPIATLSAVPDYRHNFWLHVANCLFSATGAATLTGLSVYSFGEDFSLFGQTVLYAVSQISGLFFAAIGLAAIQPFLTRPPRLRTVWWGAVILQLIAVGVTWNGWKASDAPTAGARAWWGLLHAGSALWNSGWTLRNDGLANYVSVAPVFGCMTILSVIGAIGLPIVIELFRFNGRAGGTDSIKNIDPSPGAGGATRPPLSGKPPWKRLASCEAVAALVLLLVSSGLFFVWETPRFLPDRMSPTRPVDFGGGRVSLRDEMAHHERWTMSVFLAATVRSAGLQSAPMSEGAVSWPSYGLLVALMLLGGTAAGTAGGLRTTVFLLAGMAVLLPRLSLTSWPGGAAARRGVLRECALFALFWTVLAVGVVAALCALTDGTLYEKTFEGASAVGNVGLSTGLSLHLTWPGRFVMILGMIVGRIAPAYFLLRISGVFAGATVSGK